MVPVVNVPMIGSFLMLQNRQVKITFVKEKNIAERGDWFIEGFVDAIFSGSI